MKSPSLVLPTLTLLAILICLQSHAEAAKSNISSSAVNSVSLTPTLGVYSFAGSEQLQTSLLYGVKLGYDIIGSSIVDSLGIEATYNHFSASSKTDSGSANGNIVRLDALFPFTPRSTVVPFLALGMGGISINSETNPLLNYGIGVKYFYENNLALRLDARQLFVYDNVNTRNNFEVSAGVIYYFGKESKKTPAQLADQDQDGIPDSVDKCSNTPKEVKVDRNGCPLDSDKDGVPDHLDKCPSTPVGVAVTPDGCPQSSKKNFSKPVTTVPVGTVQSNVTTTNGITSASEIVTAAGDVSALD